MPTQLLSTINLFTSLASPLNNSQSRLVEFRACNEKHYRRLFTDYLQTGSTLPSVFGGGYCEVSFLQSSFWGSFKSQQGWQPHYFCGKVEVPELRDPDISALSQNRGETEGRLEQHIELVQHEFAVLVLSRYLIPPFLSLAYIPFGPVFFRTKVFHNDLPQDNPLSGDLAEYWNPFLSTCGYFASCRLIVQKLLGHIPLSCFFVRMDSNYLVDWGPSLGRDAKGKDEGKVEVETLGTMESGDRTHRVAQAAQEMGFRRAVQRVQVPDTVLLDLQYSEQELLAWMHKKHRYNIRLAQKKGVELRQVSWREGLEEWYQIYQVTALRDKIGIHSFDYYQSLFEQLEGDSPEAHIYLYLAYQPKTPDVAEGSGDPEILETGASDFGALKTQRVLAGIIVLHYVDSAVATYMYGASGNEDRELMPNYLLQWHAICEARNAGMRCYDFFGVPPHPGPKHPLHGLYRFKVGFGGYLVQRSGAWDLAYSWLFYGIYRLLESGRSWLYQLRHR